MTLSEIRDLISGVGFPIFVAIFMMVYMRKALDANTNALGHLNETMQRVCDKLGIGHPD